MDNEQYLNEVRKALDEDTSRLGDIWRLTNENKSLTTAQIRKELKPDGKHTNYVYNYQKFIQAITEGKEPSQGLATQCGSALRGFLRRHKDAFSEETIQTLEERAKECDRRATDPQALEEENARVEKETAQALESDVPGIYVYTYPHYHRNPVMQATEDTESRTYLKIGMSEDDVFERVKTQTTGTAMPEQAMILQVWETKNKGDIQESEKKIQEHLRKVGHHWRTFEQGENYKKLSGREWFLTNEQSIEATANLLGLKLRWLSEESTIQMNSP